MAEDAALLIRRPTAHLDANANENYWAVRRQEAPSVANSFQIDRARWILSRIRLDSSTTLLDIGSGTGEMLVLFRDAGLKEILASDFSPASKTRLETLGFRVVDVDVSSPTSIESMPGADHITICEVLEHIQNAEAALTALIQKAKVSVFFSVPNTGYYVYRLRLLLGRFPVQWRAHPGEHVRYWTLSDMRWWLSSLGLADRATILPYQGWPILNRLFPGLFSKGLLVEVRRAERGAADP
jgi:2-polyprenyl-3-methyl-5-hydroxy-6-metoxy-1,4-benzoquinol methylase